MKRDMNHHQQVQALELEALTLGYPTASGLQVVLSDFSLSLAQGEKSDSTTCSPLAVG